jgi:6-phosphofructokinase
MQTQRIGVLTSGGDCPGLNAVLRGVTKAAENLRWQVIGFQDGFEGLLPPRRYIVLDRMIIVAEGAKPKDGEQHFQQNTIGEHRLGGIGEIVAGEVMERTGKESRCCVLGHLQRGGPPTAVDRLLATRFGVKAVQLIRERKFGAMVSYQNHEILDAPLADAVNRLRLVASDHQLVKTAREIGISFGDIGAEVQAACESCQDLNHLS